MDSNKIVFNEDDMKHFIQDLLCLHNDNTLIYRSSHTAIDIRFYGKTYRVQKFIYDWLSVPQRKHNFELLGG